MLAACLGTDANAQGNIRPGATATIKGKISDWPVPAPHLARDPVVDADGNIYFAVAKGDRIAQFDPRSAKFREWVLPNGTQPHGLAITADGKVFFAGSGTGTLGELDPRTGALRHFPTPLLNSRPYSLAVDGEGNVWLTQRGVGRIAKFDRTKGTFSEVPMDGDPYGLVIDSRGVVWVTRIAADSVGSYNPKTGTIRELFTGAGTKPRRLTIAPDGMLWVSLYGTGKLLKIDPVSNAKVEEYPLPGGPNSGPYSVNADALGRIWVSEYQNDVISVLEPKSGKFQTIRLPEKNSGVRNAVIDAQGRYWYLGSTSGKLGVID